MRIYCEGCQRKITVRGFIWQHRLSHARKHPEHKDCYDGWYCDECADDREMGIDYE